MSIFNSIFLSNKKGTSLKISFIKGDNEWHVTNGHTIMYIGDQDSCKTYKNNMDSAA